MKWFLIISGGFMVSLAVRILSDQGTLERSITVWLLLVGTALFVEGVNLFLERVKNE